MFGDFKNIKGETPLTEADILIAAEHLNSFKGIVEELENRGINTYQISGSEIDIENKKIGDTPLKELKGKKTLLRNKRGFEDMGLQLGKLPLDFINKPLYANAADDKLASKKLLEKNGINTPKTYLSSAQIEKELEKGNRVVEKDRKGTHGEGFNVLEPGDEFEMSGDKIFEEFIDDYENENTEERRAVVYAGEKENKIIESKNRENENGILSKIFGFADQYLPKNINAGGSYEEPEKYLEEEFETLWDTAEAFEGGILGIDYTVNTETGETQVIEVNSTVSINGIKNASEENLDEIIADSIEYELNDNPYKGKTFSDHLSKKYADPGKDKKQESPNHRHFNSKTVEKSTYPL